MTPGARVAAAIEILDAILGGDPAEKALSGWARSHRFAGSKDRAALRDHVFDALRCRESYSALGGAATGRGLMIGALRAAGSDVAQIFTGEGHAPAALTEDEGLGRVPVAGSAEALDCPGWLLPLFRASLGEDCEAVLAALRCRAPVFLRVNLRRVSRQAARDQLAAENILCEPSDLSNSALEVVSGAPRIRGSQMLASGLVDLQDAASQAVSDLVPLKDGQRMLDYCAGGGGKTLAVGGRVRGQFFAHDVNPRRMADLPVRAGRARIDVTCLTDRDLPGRAPFDVVLVDAPCSGSGSWRRDPQGKWALTPKRLEQLVALQAQVLDQAAGHVGVGGHLVYMTCSLLAEENQGQITDFLDRHPEWSCNMRRWLTPLQGGDGFFVARLEQRAATFGHKL